MAMLKHDYNELSSEELEAKKQRVLDSYAKAIKDVKFFLNYLENENIKGRFDPFRTLNKTWLLMGSKLSWYEYHHRIKKGSEIIIDLLNKRGGILASFKRASIDTSENYFTIKGPDGDPLGTFDASRYGYGVRNEEQEGEPQQNADDETNDE